MQDDGLPAVPQTGFPGNYLAMPALERAFDHFWQNSPGPGGPGLQDRYAAAWGDRVEIVQGDVAEFSADFRSARVAWLRRNLVVGTAALHLLS